MKKKAKLFLSMASMVLTVALFCFGVYAALGVSYTISGSVVYQVKDVFVNIETSLYVSTQEILTNQSELASNVSTFEGGGVATNTQKLKYSDILKTYDPSTGEITNHGTSFSKTSVSIPINYGSYEIQNQGLDNESAKGFAYYIVVEITNYGTEPIGVNIANNINTQTTNSLTKLSDSSTIAGRTGENGYTTKYIVIGMALNDATLSVKNVQFQVGISLTKIQTIENVTTNNNTNGTVSAYIADNNLIVNASPKNGSTLIGLKDSITNEYFAYTFSTQNQTITIPYNEEKAYVAVFDSNIQNQVIEGSSYIVYPDSNIAVLNNLDFGTATINLIEGESPSSINKLYLKSAKILNQVTYNSKTYNVIGILDNALNGVNTSLILPNTIKYFSPNAFGNNSNVVAISAPEQIIQSLNISNKTILDVEFDITFNEPDGDRFYTESNVNITIKDGQTKSEVCKIEFLNANGSSTGGDYDYGGTSQLAILGLSNSNSYDLVTDIYTYISGNGVSGYPQIVESALIKVNNSTLYQTSGGSLSDYSYANNTTHTWEKSYQNVVNNNDNINIALWFTYSVEANPCFVAGSLITLADGSVKPVEDITYDDLILVWDFNRGTYTGSYPVWITKQLTTKKYYKITFDDGSVFKNVVAHRLYSVDEDYFVKSVDAGRSQVGHYFFALDTINGIPQKENGEILFTQKKMVSIEIVYETAYYYNLITGYTMNVFVDSILTSCGMNNLYGKFTDETIENGKVVNGMTYNLDLMEQRQNGVDTLYTYDELDVPMSFFYGYRLAEQKGVRDIESINQYVENNYVVMKEIPKSNNGKNIWAVSTSDDDVFAENYVPNKIEEGSTYTLLQPENTTNFVGWYNVADGKMYGVGDEVVIRMGTYFEAIYR